MSIIPLAFAYDGSFFSSPLPIIQYSFENNLKNRIDGTEAIGIGDITYTDGIHGKAVKLAPDSSIVIPNSNNLNFGSGFAISFWSKIPANAANFDDNTNMITKGSEFFFRVDPFNESPNRVAFFISVNGVVEPRVWAPYVPNTWQHWTVTWDGSTLKMYKDGLLFMYGISTSAQNRMGPLDIDNSNLILGGKGFAGEIEDLRIYDKPLSDSDVFAQTYGISLLAIELIILVIGSIGIIIHHIRKTRPKTI